MPLLAAALSRSQCAKKSTEDELYEDISEDLLKFFCNWYMQDNPISVDILKKSSVWISLASGIHRPTFPRETKSEGSQTSGHFIMSNELEEATTCRTWGSLHFPVDILMSTKLVDRHVHHTSLTASQESDPLLQVLSGEITCEWGWDSGSSTTARFLPTLCKDADAPSQDATERSRLHTFIADHPSKLHVFLPADCSPSMMCAVKRSDIQHGLEGQTVVTAGTHFCWVLNSWLDTLQPVGFDDERYFCSADKTLMTLIIEEILEDIDDFPWTDQLGMHDVSKNEEHWIIPRAQWRVCVLCLPVVSTPSMTIYT